MSYPLKPFPVPAVPPVISAKNLRKAENSFTQKLYKDFWNTPASDIRKVLENTSANVWRKEAEKRTLQVFHAAAERVPAYKDFLKKSGVKPRLIKGISDFEKIPTIDKKNYLLKYPFEALCWDGTYERSEMVAVSSGSTGTPFLWPRDGRLEIETTFFFELLMDSFFSLSSKKTLIVDCFSMGMYVGGPFFLNASLRAIQKGYPATIITPGNVMGDIIRVISEIGERYEQVILSGYPPFLKDVIEQGQEAGIQWNRFRTVLFPAGEGFTESWRKTVAELTQSTDIYSEFLGYYGTADAAVLGFETPWSIELRQAIGTDTNDLLKVFGGTRMPSFMQYIPTQRYFEAIEGNLHFTTGNGSIPLVRYNIGDQGGVFTFNEGKSLCDSSEGGKIFTSNRYGVPWQLPFVFVYGRSDHTVILYGANIYPENIKGALEAETLPRTVSGRFVMDVVDDHNENRKLVIYVERGRRSNGSASKLAKEVQDVVVRYLKKNNTEYADASRAIGTKALPHIVICDHGDEKYFGRTSKQQWRKRKP